MGEGFFRKEAVAKARALEKFWHDKGFTEVRCIPEGPVYDQNGNVGCWSIKSNIVNGLPPSLQKNRDRVELPK